MSEKVIVIYSGGMDSYTVLNKAIEDGKTPYALSFDYGQRHSKELDYAARAAARLGVPHETIDIRAIGAHLTGSALTDNVDVPDGHYAEETMKITIVPNRNAIMLAIAFGVAASRGADAVATAVHGGDHFIYPDCRPEFIKSFEAMQKQALDGYADVSLYTPFVNSPKSEIVAAGAAIDVPFAETWSCYKGGEIQCGKCGTCVERREAFQVAGLTDPTEYLETGDLPASPAGD